MFKRDPSKNATTPVQKVLTYGLIFFIAYIYFGESKRKAEIENMPINKVIKVTNVITGETKEFSPETKKIDLSIRADDIPKLKEKPVGSPQDKISLFEIQFSDPSSMPEKTDVKAEIKKEEKSPEKPSENSNVDAKPVSN